MASNKHFSVDLSEVSFVEVEPPTLDSLLEIQARANEPTPFGSVLMNGSFVRELERFWVFSSLFDRFRYDEFGRDHQNTLYKISLRFDSALSVSDIDADKFQYSFIRNFQTKKFPGIGRHAGFYARSGAILDGSIRSDVFLGIIAFGTMLSSYSSTKQSVRELIEDIPYIVSITEKALRASKNAETPPKERNHPSEEMRVLPSGVRRETPDTWELDDDYSARGWDKRGNRIWLKN